MIFDPPDVCAQFPAIGGGSSYDPDAFDSGTKYPSGPRITKADADVAATSRSELPGDPDENTTIWIPGDVTIDLGPSQRRWVRDGITLASSRDADGSGALLHTSKRTQPAISIDGDGCRVTGLRLRGPEPESFDDDGYPASTGISINGNQCEIDNCLIRGWTHAGVELGRSKFPKFAHLHHNTIVDNHAKGLGYGVTVFQGHPHVRACYLDNNRHSIAGTGQDRCSWTLVDSIVGAHHRLHALDMHAGNDGRAGKMVSVRRSILLPTHNWYNSDGPSEYRQETLSLRGIPREASQIYNNLWVNSEPTEPMRDSANNAINVHGAGNFAEAKLSGLDSNTFGWTGGAIPEGVGPVRDASVTGYAEEPEPTPEEPQAGLTKQDVYTAARRAAEDVLREGVDQ